GIEHICPCLRTCQRSLDQPVSVVSPYVCVYKEPRAGFIMSSCTLLHIVIDLLSLYRHICRKPPDVEVLLAYYNKEVSISVEPALVVVSVAIGIKRIVEIGLIQLLVIDYGILCRRILVCTPVKGEVAVVRSRFRHLMGNSLR